MSVEIKYNDVAPGAKENFHANTADILPFVHLEQLQEDNLNVKNYANPCELYQTLLDGRVEEFPYKPQYENMGLWSKSVTAANGTFKTPPVLTLETSGGRYSSQGLTLTFDTDNNIFCNSLNVCWYRDNELIANIDFTPDNPFYYCRYAVEAYNKVVITFNSLNMPYNRLKLRAIDYGYITFFGADELRNVNIIQEIDPISENLIINTCDFTFQRKNPSVEYSFQSKQTLSVSFNGALRATCFIDKSTRKGYNLWGIQTIDYVGLLDNIKFMGGMYENKNAAELLALILNQAKIPFTISEDLFSKNVTGYIPVCTGREAIAQICFAIGAVADTSNSNKFDIYKLPTRITQNVTKDRIKQGQSFTDNDKITEIQLTVHKYTKSDEESEIYKAEESGTGTNIFVEFSEPLHDLNIVKGSIISSGTNYAVIDAQADCVLTGYKYIDGTTVKSKTRPDLLASDIENVKSITNKTLISSDNVDDILQLCYEHFTKNTTINLGIYENTETVKYGTVQYGTVKYGENLLIDPVNVGEYITTDTEYLGTLQGRIVSERFNLNGGIILKECEMK